MRMRDILEATHQSKSLYHGCSILGLLGIIRDGAILPNGDDGYHRGVSLTSSLDAAEYFAAAQERAVEERLEEPPHGNCTGAVLIFDRARLMAQVQLKPVFWNDNDSEKEERTVGAIRPALTSVTGIRISGRDLKWYTRLIRNREDYMGEEAKLASVEQALRWLTASPLRKRWPSRSSSPIDLF